MWDDRIPSDLLLKYGKDRYVVNLTSKTVSVMIDDIELSDAIDFLSSGGVEMAGPMTHFKSIDELGELIVNAKDIGHVGKALKCEGDYVWLLREKLASVIVGETIKLDLALLVQLGVPFNLAACKVAREA